MIKKNEGITMIQMVVTIVMMIIIASFSIYNARDTIIESKLSRTYNEMTTVKNAVTQFLIFEEDGTDILGEELGDLNEYPGLSTYFVANQKYHLLNFVDDGPTLCETLEVENIKNNYVVNVKTRENIEIFLANGINIGDQKYYSYGEILEKYNNVFAGR